VVSVKHGRQRAFINGSLKGLKSGDRGTKVPRKKLTNGLLAIDCRSTIMVVRRGVYSEIVKVDK